MRRRSSCQGASEQTTIVARLEPPPIWPCCFASAQSLAWFQWMALAYWSSALRHWRSWRRYSSILRLPRRPIGSPFPLQRSLQALNAFSRLGTRKTFRATFDPSFTCQSGKGLLRFLRRAWLGSRWLPRAQSGCARKCWSTEPLAGTGFALISDIDEMWDTSAELRNLHRWSSTRAAPCAHERRVTSQRCLAFSASRALLL